MEIRSKFKIICSSGSTKIVFFIGTGLSNPLNGFKGEVIYPVKVGTPVNNATDIAANGNGNETVPGT